MSLGQVPPSEDLDRLRERRAALGLPHGDDAPLLIHADGERVTAAQVPLHLRRARLHARGHRGERRHVPRPARQAVRRHVLKSPSTAPPAASPAGPWHVRLAMRQPTAGVRS